MAHAIPLFAAGQPHLQSALRVLGEQGEGAVVHVWWTLDDGAVAQLVLEQLAIGPIHLVEVVLVAGIVLRPEIWLVGQTALVAVLAATLDHVVLAGLVVHYGRIVEHAQGAHVVVVAGQHVRVLFEEERVRNVQGDGQRLQYKAGQRLEVRGQGADVVRKSWQRLLWQILSVQCADIESVTQLRRLAIESLLLTTTHVAMFVSIGTDIVLSDVRRQIHEVIQVIPGSLELIQRQWRNFVLVKRSTITLKLNFCFISTDTVPPGIEAINFN